MPMLKAVEISEEARLGAACAAVMTRACSGVEKAKPRIEVPSRFTVIHTLSCMANSMVK